MNPTFKITIYVMLALIALAGNSILCRLALAENEIDAASFTAVRLVSGALTLMMILAVSQYISKSRAGRERTPDFDKSRGSWSAAFMLFIYAIAFSYAYISLDTGVGALILFGAVQITMISVGLLQGQKLHLMEWLGILAAFAGFIYLVFPGVTAPSLTGFVLMAVAGIAWGFYTLAGKKSTHALRDTSFNFLRTLPLVGMTMVVSIQYVEISQKGIMLAVMSGAVASGIGYTIWYTVLAWLTAVQAAVLQLLIPVIAAVGGIIFADELLSLRLVISGLMILSGIFLVIFGKFHAAQRA